MRSVVLAVAIAIGFILLLAMPVVAGPVGFSPAPYPSPAGAPSRIIPTPPRPDCPPGHPCITGPILCDPVYPTSSPATWAYGIISFIFGYH